MAEIVLDHVTKRYPDGATPVKGLSLTIGDGEFVILVGPSGCGKSTTLNMIAGLEDITDGELLIGGQRVNEKAPRDRDIAMVFQSYALYPHMTVRQNIAFPLTLAKMGKAEIAAKVAETAKILDLTALLDRKPSQLSGGQRQRVAMGRAIVLAGFRHFDGLRRVQAARSGKDDAVGGGRFQQIGQPGVAAGAGFLDGGSQCGGVDVTDVDEFAAVGVRFHCGEVVLRDTAAADEGEADLAVGDRGGEMHVRVSRR